MHRQIAPRSGGVAFSYAIERATLGNVIMKKPGAGVYYQYSFYNHKWEEHKEITLTDNEREVLSLSTQGYTMNDIADQICKSVDTVKACKRSIFQNVQ